MFGREKYHYSGEYLTLLYFLCRARPWCRCVRSRRDWGHCPGSEGSQTNPARCGHKGSLFTVLGRSSSVWRMPWGGLPGAGQGHRDALPNTGLQPALGIGQREKKIISSLEVNHQENVQKGTLALFGKAGRCFTRSQ